MPEQGGWNQEGARYCEAALSPPATIEAMNTDQVLPRAGALVTSLPEQSLPGRCKVVLHFLQVSAQTFLPQKALL